MSGKWESANGAFYQPEGQKRRRIHLSRRRKFQLAKEQPSEDFTRILTQMYFSMRKRATKRAFLCLTRDELWSLWRRANGACEVSGIPFSLERLPGSAARPWAPSIDRIDAAGDYQMDNCRIVCWAVNLAMSQWGHEVLLRIAKALYARSEVRE